MKQKVNKILAIIIALIIIIGIVIISTKGFNFALKYQANKNIEINLGKEFNKNDIKEITNEVLGSQKANIEAIELYKDSVKITSIEITEEQKNDIVTRINEKYETEIKAEDVVINESGNIRGRDIIKNYIVPFAIATVIIIAYQMIRYNKLNVLKVLVKSICYLVVSQALLFSILAITRISVSEYITAAILVVYMLSISIPTIKFEKELENKKNK